VGEVSYKSLGDAIERLREALVLLKAHPAGDDLHTTVRNSTLLSFMFTYELAGALLRRFLQANMVTHGDTTEMTFPTLIRVGSEHGLLLHDWERWFEYRKARNTMSHAYDEARAKLAVELAPQFLEEAEFLYKRLMEEIR
jgi:nucleotidyltransferase substrate binding protein (TIGR01987 family)